MLVMTFKLQRCVWCQPGCTYANGKCWVHSSGEVFLNRWEKPTVWSWNSIGQRYSYIHLSHSLSLSLSSYHFTKSPSFSSFRLSHFVSITLSLPPSLSVFVSFSLSPSITLSSSLSLPLRLSFFFPLSLFLPLSAPSYQPARQFPKVFSLRLLRNRDLPISFSWWPLLIMLFC